MLAHRIVARNEYYVGTVPETRAAYMFSLVAALLLCGTRRTLAQSAPAPADNRAGRAPGL
jgi:hypothetical protein